MYIVIIIIAVWSTGIYRENLLTRLCIFIGNDFNTIKINTSEKKKHISWFSEVDAQVNRTEVFREQTSVMMEVFNF